MARFTQALPLFLALALSPERAEAFTPWTNNLQYPVSGTVLGSSGENLTPQGNENGDQNRQEGQFGVVNRQKPMSVASVAKNRNKGAYHYLLGPKPRNAPNAPKASTGAQKQPTYPQRYVSAKSNPYPERFNRPFVSNDANYNSNNSAQRYNVGSYLDSFAGGSPIDEAPAMQNQAAASMSDQMPEPTTGSNLNNLRGSPPSDVKKDTAVPKAVELSAPASFGSYVDNLARSSSDPASSKKNQDTSKSEAIATGSSLDRSAGGSSSDLNPPTGTRQIEADAVDKLSGPTAPASGSKFDNLKDLSSSSSPAASEKNSPAASEKKDDAKVESSQPSAPDSFGSYVDNLARPSSDPASPTKNQGTSKSEAIPTGSSLDRSVGKSSSEIDPPAMPNEAAAFDNLSGPRTQATGSKLDKDESSNSSLAASEKKAGVKAKPSPAIGGVQKQATSPRRYVSAKSNPYPERFNRPFVSNDVVSSSNNTAQRNNMGSYLDRFADGSPIDFDVAPPSMQNQAAAAMSEQVIEPTTGSDFNDLRGSPPSEVKKDAAAVPKTFEPSPPGTGSYLENLQRYVSSPGSSKENLDVSKSEAIATAPSPDRPLGGSSTDVDLPATPNEAVSIDKLSGPTAPTTGSNLDKLKDVSFSGSPAASEQKDDVKAKPSQPSPQATDSYLDNLKRYLDSPAILKKNQDRSKSEAIATGSSLDSSAGGSSSDIVPLVMPSDEAAIDKLSGPPAPITGSGLRNLKDVSSSRSPAASEKKEDNEAKPSPSTDSYLGNLKDYLDNPASTKNNQFTSKPEVPTARSSLDRSVRSSGDVDPPAMQKEAAAVDKLSGPTASAPGSDLDNLKGMPSSSCPAASEKKDDVKTKPSQPSPPTDSYLDNLKRYVGTPASTKEDQVTSKPEAPTTGSSLDRSGGSSSDIDLSSMQDGAAPVSKSFQPTVPETGSNLDNLNVVSSSSSDPAGSEKKDDVKAKPSHPSSPGTGSYLYNLQRYVSGQTSSKKSCPAAPASEPSLDRSTGGGSSDIDAPALVNEEVPVNKSNQPVESATGINIGSVKKDYVKGKVPRPSPPATDSYLDNLQRYVSGQTSSKKNQVTSKPEAPPAGLAGGSSNDIDAPALLDKEAAVKKSNQVTTPEAESNVYILKGASASVKKDDVTAKLIQQSPPATGSYLENLQRYASSLASSNVTKSKAITTGSSPDRPAGGSPSDLDPPTMQNEAAAADKLSTATTPATGSDLDNLKDVTSSRSPTAREKDDVVVNSSQPSAPASFGSYIDNLARPSSDSDISKKNQDTSKSEATATVLPLDRSAGGSSSDLNPPAMPNEAAAIDMLTGLTAPATGSDLDNLKDASSSSSPAANEEEEEEVIKAKASQPPPPTDSYLDNLKRYLDNPAILKKDQDTNKPEVPTTGSSFDRSEGSSSDADPSCTQDGAAAVNMSYQPRVPATGSKGENVKDASSSNSPAASEKKDNVKAKSSQSSAPASFGSYVDNLARPLKDPMTSKKNEDMSQSKAPAATGSSLDMDVPAVENEAPATSMSNRPTAPAAGTNIDKPKNVPSTSGFLGRKNQPTLIKTIPESAAAKFGSYIENLKRFKDTPSTTGSVGTQNQGTPTKSGQPAAPGMNSYVERFPKESISNVQDAEVVSKKLPPLSENAEPAAASTKRPSVPAASVVEPRRSAVSSKGPTPRKEASVIVSAEQIGRIRREAEFGKEKADELFRKDGLALEERIDASIAEAKSISETKRRYKTVRENLRNSWRRTSQSSYEQERAAERLADIRSKMEVVDNELDVKLDKTQAKIDKEVRRDCTSGPF